MKFLQFSITELERSGLYKHLQSLNTCPVCLATPPAGTRMVQCCNGHHVCIHCFRDAHPAPQWVDLSCLFKSEMWYRRRQEEQDRRDLNLRPCPNCRVPMNLANR